MTDRQAEHDIEPLILHRWSPRAFDASALDEATLMRLFEAARWAPSSFNYQPWTFLYAQRDDANWDSFLSALIPFNQSWAKNASVLIYILSDTMSQKAPQDTPTPSHSHSFDAGAAWMALALQAQRLGLHAHGMTGVDMDAARRILNVPDRLRIEAAVAVGRRADPSVLPEQMHGGEKASSRKPLADIVRAGPLPA
ncbi:nitroreductase family protein [Sphingobium subterraneum]|uniref:Nitroreductase n=1 Tax=Sphingobium subterraneum TaxID=627688 RepID=A0A841IZI3_9SPHN|nr:nitroreductase family protein [Sphingobium subterraneum]MBB6124073.1 nitroreductase [Sphingobium subterraneum]